MAQWTSKYKDNLPKSSYAWVDSKGVGHLPYKDADGKVDLPHVRNALARLNQVQGMSDSERAAVKAKLEKLLGSKAADEYSYLKDAIELTEHKEIQIFPFGKWNHPKWGNVTMTPERAQNFVQNYDSAVYGQDVPIDFAHGKDVSKGDKAAGWVTGLSVKEDGLYASVDLTQTAANEIRAGEWRYFSPTFWDHWESPLSGETVSDLLVGGALTNRPFLKGIAPLNFEEISMEVPEWMHVNPPNAVNPPAKPEDFDAWQNQERGEPIFENYQPPGTTNVKNNLDEGGEMDEFEKKLRALLKLDEKADIEAAVKSLSEDAAQARELRETVAKQKTFQEMFPEEYAEQQTNREYRKTQQAKEFAETYLRPIGTVDEKGSAVRPAGALPPVVIEKLTNAAKNFSEDDFKEFGAILDDIVNVGLVPVGEIGTTGADKGVGVTSGTKKSDGTLAQQIAAGVQAMMAEDDKLSYQDAVHKFAEKEPDLYREYTEHGIPQTGNAATA